MTRRPSEDEDAKNPSNHRKELPGDVEGGAPLRRCTKGGRQQAEVTRSARGGVEGSEKNKREFASCGARSCPAQGQAGQAEAAGSFRRAEEDKKTEEE